MATPPDFTTGAVLTAAQMNAVGLWLVKSQTIGSAVSGVDVTDAFSTDYDNYLISYSTVDSSVDQTGIFFRFGTIASPVTTNYKFAGKFMGYTGTNLDLNQNTPGYWEVGGTETDIIAGAFNVYGPNLNARSTFTASFARSDAAFTIQGIHDASTQHTGFHIYPASGTLTGGKIRVYGYRN
jgi:hypothetical protein